MKVELLSIGDELLIGQVVNTNSSYIAAQFSTIGLEVAYISVCGDSHEAIIEALHTAHHRASLILVTGGLGPTKDDLTKEAICDFFDDRLEENQEALEHIKHLFETHIQTPIRPANLTQALLPSKAIILKNGVGTASGMWFEGNKKITVFLPGVPREMQYILKHELLERLAALSSLSIRHRTLLTYGLGESAIAERIDAIASDLPDGLSLAYLPNFGRVRLRLTAKGADLKKVEELLQVYGDRIADELSDIYFGDEEQGGLAPQLLNLARQKQLTVASCESCTGGRIASYLTATPGASSVFVSGIVAYQTMQKTQLLGISTKLIETYSVVSKEVAEEMALASRLKTGASIAVSTTGNAGPEKGDSDADVGTVFIGISTEEHTFAHEFNFGNLRERVVEKASLKALEMLYREIAKK